MIYKKSKIAFKEFKKINEVNKNKFVVASDIVANKIIREIITTLCE